MNKFSIRVMLIILSIGLGTLSDSLFAQTADSLASALGAAAQRSGSSAAAALNKSSIKNQESSGSTPIIITQTDADLSRRGAIYIEGGEKVLVDISLRESQDPNIALSRGDSSSYNSGSSDRDVDRTTDRSKVDVSKLRQTNDASDSIASGYGAKAEGHAVLRALTQEHKEYIERVMGGNPYTLDRTGNLVLPGIGPIALGGLNEADAQKRIAYEPSLAAYSIRIHLLRISNPSTLLFGADFFSHSSTALIPGSDIPAPDNYRLGEGDKLSVQTSGRFNEINNVTVGRDGYVNIPELGPINVGNQSYADARSTIEAQVARQMVGTSVRVSLTEVRSARVVVVGEVEHPGSYVIAGLSTPISALFVAGGVKSIGSLRNVEIRRDGKLIKKIDLYDSLLKGIMPTDVRLVTGDVIFVPPIGPKVVAEGEVQRPGVYELSGKTTVKDFMWMTGGLTVTADHELARITRTGATGANTVALNLRKLADLNQELHDGDTFSVNRIPDLVTNEVQLSNDFTLTSFAYFENMRISDVIKNREQLGKMADTQYVVIHRIDANNHVSAVSVNMEDVFANPNSKQNISLYPRDHVYVFDKTVPRYDSLRPLIAQLERQSNPEHLPLIADISGEVYWPGRYPLEDGMTVQDLIRAAGGLKPSAYLSSAELVRSSSEEGGQIKENLVIGLSQDSPGYVKPLAPLDRLAIRQIPNWGSFESVKLYGEVRFPGTYIIEHGETLSHVIERAGGYNDRAFLQGGIFLRESLRQREQEQIQRLVDRAQASLTVLAASTLSAQVQIRGQPQSLNSQTNEGAANYVLGELKSAKAIGRMVVDFNALRKDNFDASADVVLNDGDVIAIPLINNEVTVIGEVQNPTSFHFKKGMTVNSLVEVTGGFTENANKGTMYVVRADGSVVSKSAIHSSNIIRPGDSLIVPLDISRLPALVQWQGLSSILYNLAVTLAALKTVGVF